MENLEPNVSGSLQDQLGTPNIGYEVKGDDRIVAVLVKELDQLKNKVHELETKKILDETQLPVEVLTENHLLPSKPKKLKRGRGYRPILKSEIEESQRGAVNMAAAARKMGISQCTYKKYAKLYNLWNPHPCLKGKRSIHDPERGKFPIARIITGEFNGHPSVTDWMVKDKLIRSGIKELKCEQCGLSERRTGDNKVPLLLNHIDDDGSNFKLENLKLLCLNCTFYAGRGYIRRGKFVFDPDWMQGMDAEELGKPPRY